MSMNLCLSSSREIFNRHGESLGLQTERFDLIQTPTNVSYELVAQEDVHKAYSDWVMSNDKLDTVGVHSGTDEERWDKEWNDAPYDYYIYWSYGVSHLKEMNEWIEDQIKQGYDIEWYVV